MNYRMLFVKMLLIGLAVIFFLLAMDGFTSHRPNGYAIQGPLCATLWLVCCAIALLWRDRAETSVFTTSD